MKLSLEGSITQVQRFVSSLRASGEVQADIYAETLELSAPKEVSVNIFQERKHAKKKHSAKGRVLSAAARKQISIAQKARWAKWHKEQNKK